MKAENTEVLRTGINEENLRLVSGGTEDGKIGPKDARVKEALGYIKDAQLFIPKTKYRVTEIPEILEKVVGSLSGPSGFSIAKAVTLLKKAWAIFASMPTPPLPPADFQRAMIIGGDIQKARNILDPLV